MSTYDTVFLEVDLVAPRLMNSRKEFTSSMTSADEMIGACMATLENFLFWLYSNITTHMVLINKK
jgi:hypothetical protein